MPKRVSKMTLIENVVDAFIITEGRNRFASSTSRHKKPASRNHFEWSSAREKNAFVSCPLISTLCYHCQSRYNKIFFTLSHISIDCYYLSAEWIFIFNVQFCHFPNKSSSNVKIYTREPIMRMKRRRGKRLESILRVCTLMRFESKCIVIRRMSKLNELSYGFWSMLIDNHDFR